MRRWDDRREQGATPLRPSAVSGERLAERVKRDVADVRVRLEEAVLRGDALLAAGHPACAAAVIDEQQALMDELRESVEASVAGAVVEAQAEAVLAAAPDSPEMFGADELLPADEPVTRRPLRAAASAVLSAVAAVAFMVMASTPPGPQTFAAAGVDDDAAAAPDPSEADADRVTATDRLTERAETERAIGPNELEVRRLFSAPAPGDATTGPDLEVPTALPSLQSLVDRLVATVGRVADELTGDRAPQVELVPARDEDDAADERTDDADEGADDGSSAPADEPAPSDEDAGDPGSGASGGDRAPFPGEGVLGEQVEGSSSLGDGH